LAIVRTAICAGSPLLRVARSPDDRGRRLPLAHRMTGCRKGTFRRAFLAPATDRTSGADGR